MNIVHYIQRKKWHHWMPEALTLLGLIVYLIQSFWFAHTTISNLDEGGYLYKGLLFVQNVYRPFQEYGFWTNKAPLVYLIPGYAQLIFGEGLRTGRYLAIFEGVVALAGLWVVTCRMSGRWLAGGAVWVMALSPSVIKVYSVGASQSLVACLITWVLALSLGRDRPLWQLVLSSMLASVMILARQNMIPVLPILLLYIAWQHGWVAAGWSTFAGLSIFIFGHAVYWPEILQIWVGWFPYLFPSWSAYLVPDGGTSIWQPAVPISGRWLSVFQGFRWHLIALSGCLFGVILWPQRNSWRDAYVFKAVVFLGGLFIVLLYMHSFASLDKSYCVFCFAPYLSFFNFVAVILITMLISNWDINPSRFSQLVLIVLVIVICTGVGYSTFEENGRWLANLSVPRVRDGRILSGFTTLGSALMNKFSMEASLVRKVVSAGAGFTFALVLLLSIRLANLKGKYNYGYLLASSFLIVGLLVSPIIAGPQGSADCKMDIIKSNEQVGAYLEQVLPAEGSLYWDGGLSVAPLLYASSARIYPPQVNDGYSFKYGGDSDALLKFGLWNDELAARWKGEAQIIIVEEWRYPDWQAFLTPDKFEELPRTPAATSCLDGTRLRIFKRIQ